MLGLFNTLSLRYLRLRWGLNVLVVLSIALGVAIWVATSALYATLESSILASANPLAGITDLYVSNSAGGVPRSLEARLAAVAGVRSVRPIVIEPIQVVLDGQKAQHALLLGMTLPKKGGTEAVPEDIRISDLSWFESGLALASGQVPALVGRGLQADLPENTRAFKVQAAGRIHVLRRIGTIEARGPIAALGGNVILVECDTAARLLNRPGRVSRLDIVLEPGARRDEVVGAVTAVLQGPDDGQVRTPQAEDNRLREALAPLKVGAMICSAGALVVGMFLVFNTLSVSVAERRHDIGVLRSVGATRDQICNLFLGEATLLGLLGSLGGVPLGLGLAQLMLGPIRQLVGEALFPVAMQPMALIEMTGTLVTAAAAGTATSVVAALIPAVQAAREEPADAVRRVPSGAGLPARLLQLAACLFFVAAGAGLMAARDHLLIRRAAAFAGIGCLFVATFLAIALLSAVAARVLRLLAQRFFPVEGRLAADNLVRAPGRTGLVIAALAAGVALMAHTAGIIRSNETAVLAWLEHSVTADLIVTSGGPVSSTGQILSMEDAVGGRLAEMVPGGRIVPIRFHYTSWQRDDGEELVVVVSVDAVGLHAANAERDAAGENLDLIRRLGEEPGTALVSENFSSLFRVKIGDNVTVQGERGPVSMRVIGTVEDYTNPRGIVAVHRDHFAGDFRTDQVDIFDVYLPPGAGAAEIERARESILQSALAAEYRLVTLTGPELRRNVADMLRRLYGLAYLQEFVVAIVAALGVVAALLISVIQRRRELGLLRAVGATQAQVLRTVLFEALLMGLVGCVLGVLFGFLLEWYAVGVILHEESGFAFPVILPWREAAIISGLALGSAALAGLLPGERAARLHIADAIAYE
jgi:putative ABC transport system permease protein